MNVSVKNSKWKKPISWAIKKWKKKCKNRSENDGIKFGLINIDQMV